MNKTEDPIKALNRTVRSMAERSAIQPMAGIGVIVSPPPNLKVKYHGFIVDSQYLYVDEYWVPGHTRHLVGETSYRGGGSGYAEYESHNHPIDNDESFTDTWKVGDKVQMTPLTDDDGKTTIGYVVSCKLVRLDGN